MSWAGAFAVLGLAVMAFALWPWSALGVAALLVLSPLVKR
jgi:hypothetical protein